MANYPTLPLLTKVTPANGVDIDISSGGGVRGRDLGAANVYKVDITHPLIDSAELATLTTFYGTNKGLVVTVTAGDGNTYDCLITKEPTVTIKTPIRFDAKASLIGTRN